MSIKTRSFDASPIYAFAESKAKARNPVGKEPITPIIIITPTIRQVTRDKWDYHDGWLHSQSLVGPDLYDRNPEQWHEGIKGLIQGLEDVEDFDWDSDKRIKPNYVIWLWQPTHASLGHVDEAHVFDLTGDPPYPRNATTVTSVRITSTSLLTVGGERLPDVVESVRQIPISSELLQLSKPRVYREDPISHRQAPAGLGMHTPMRMPRVGEVHNPGTTYYWLPQPSLSQLFLESMEDRPLDCVQENPTPTMRNRRVYVLALSTLDLAQFTDPFVALTPRRLGVGEPSPKNDFIDVVEQYRSRKDEPDRCGGDGKVEVTWRTWNTEWTKPVGDIIRP